MMMSVVLLSLLIAVGSSDDYIVNSVRKPGLQSAGVTTEPQFLSTIRYGPVSRGRVRGTGNREATLTFSRSGTATGSLFSKDSANAEQRARKGTGYEYRYR